MKCLAIHGVPPTHCASKVETWKVPITAQSNSPARNYELHTGDMQPVQHEGLTIFLLQLAPYPFSSRMTPPEEYRATLKVAR